MEQGQMSQRDLIPYIGNRSKLFEVLAGKQRLILKMIRALNKGMGLPGKDDRKP